jgi:predicted pyridoxine 5'-phosphate oxidase superfamily flavin-nucleotide-binding protein
VSHRGGAPGFVRVDDEGTLTLPDYAGNLFFNTLGNLQVDPRAGLLFIDFERGDLLHVAATARLVWEGPELAAFGGAQRLLRLTVDQVVRVTGGLPLAWTDLPDR